MNNWNQNDANNFVYALASTPPTVLHNGQYWQWDPQFATGPPGITEEPGIDNGTTQNSPWIACEKQTICTWVSIPHDMSGGWPPPSAGSNDWFGLGNELGEEFADKWSVFGGSRY